MKIGPDIFPALLQVKQADILAQSDYKRQEKMEKLELYQVLYQGIIEKQQCLAIKDLAINGADLIALGMSPGKELGEVLKQLLDMVLEEPELNTKEKLIQQVHNLTTPFI